MELKILIEAAAVQAGLLDDLLAVLERETAEMGAVNLTAMGCSNNAKEELLNKIAAHAPVLKRAVSGVAVREGLGAEGTFSVMAKLLEKKGVSEPLMKQRQIKATADKIQQVAGLNREIAERFSSTVSTTLNLITRLINQSSVYGSSGGYQQPRTGAIMINMEA